MVRAELWNGARAGHEQAVLRDMERDLVELPLTPEVWDTLKALVTKAIMLLAMMMLTIGMMPNDAPISVSDKSASRGCRRVAASIG